MGDAAPQQGTRLPHGPAPAVAASEGAGCWQRWYNSNRGTLVAQQGFSLRHLATSWTIIQVDSKRTIPCGMFLHKAKNSSSALHFSPAASQPRGTCGWRVIECAMDSRLSTITSYSRFLERIGAGTRDDAGCNLFNLSTADTVHSMP